MKRRELYTDTIAFPATKNAGTAVDIESDVMYNYESSPGALNLHLIADDSSKITDNLSVVAKVSYDKGISWKTAATYTDLANGTGAVSAFKEDVVKYAPRVKLLGSFDASGALAANHGCEVFAELREAENELRYQVDTDVITVASTVSVAADVAATGILTLSGVVEDGETVSIGTDVYEFTADTAQTVTGSNIAVDIQANTTASEGTLTVDGVVVEGENFTIGDETFEFTAGGELSDPANIEIDISGAASIVAAQGTLTVDTQPTVGQAFSIGDETFSFVEPGDFDTDGEISIGTDLATVQAAIVAAINGTDGVNTGSSYVTAAEFNTNDCVLTAIAKGTSGNSIATITTMDGGTNGFDDTDLGTTTAGVDCPYDEASTFIETVVNANSSYVSVVNTDGSIVLTALVGGTVGDTIATTIGTMVNGAFDDTQLGTTTSGVDCPAADAITALVSAVTASDTEGVGAADGEGDTVDFTADVAGSAGNAITTTTTISNGAFAAGTLTGGSVDVETVGDTINVDQVVQKVVIISTADASKLTDITFKLQSSNDGNDWWDASTEVDISSSNFLETEVSNKLGTYFRIILIADEDTGAATSGHGINFDLMTLYA